jgi:hypothetical protein
MKDRYLFLDIDGVLNTLDYAKACQWKDGKVRDEYGALFIISSSSFQYSFIFVE